MVLLYPPITAFFKDSNNILEFLAAIINMWIDILATNHLQSGDCALLMMDSSMAEGWMCKTNFRESNEDQIQTDVRIEAAQKFSMDFTEHGIKSYSQWFPGKENIVVDTLSHNNVELMMTSPQIILFCPPLGAQPLQNCTTAQQNCLVADLAAVEAAHQRAVQGSTHKNQAWAWRRWNKYCKSIGLINAYLDNFSHNQQIKLMGVFPIAMCKRPFLGDFGTLAEGTVKSAISYVVSTFRENGQTNPTKDKDMELGWILHRLVQAFKNKDPKIEHQKAVPHLVISELWKRQNTKIEKVLAQLTVSAYFFACCSCAYLKVPQNEKQRTDILKLSNIRFFKDGKQVHAPSLDLCLADIVSLTFKMQKDQEKFHTVMHGTTGHEFLCPVRQWAVSCQSYLELPRSDNVHISVSRLEIQRH
jgi:hypothetical protein